MAVVVLAAVQACATLLSTWSVRRYSLIALGVLYGITGTLNMGRHGITH